MGVTNAKGEAMVLPFDLVLIRKPSGALERVQCKYTESDGRVIDVRCASTSAWVRHTYRADEVDWIAVYDATTRLRTASSEGSGWRAPTSIRNHRVKSWRSDQACSLC